MRFVEGEVLVGNGLAEEHHAPTARLDPAHPFRDFVQVAQPARGVGRRILAVVSLEIFDPPGLIAVTSVRR